MGGAKRKERSRQTRWGLKPNSLLTILSLFTLSLLLSQSFFVNYQLVDKLFFFHFIAVHVLCIHLNASHLWEYFFVDKNYVADKGSICVTLQMTPHRHSLSCSIKYVQFFVYLIIMWFCWSAMLQTGLFFPLANVLWRPTVSHLGNRLSDVCGNSAAPPVFTVIWYWIICMCWRTCFYLNNFLLLLCFSSQ